MNKWLLAMVAVFAIIGCKSKNDPVTSGCDVTSYGVEVRFNVLGLDVKQEAMAVARQAVSGLDDPSDAGLTELWVMEGDSVLCHQVSSDAEFGSPEVMLTVGAHSLTFIGSSKEGQQVVGGVWSANSTSETYGAVVDLDVVSGMDVQAVVLSHVNYLINWLSTDVVVNDAFEAYITISGKISKLGAGLNGAGNAEVYRFDFDPAYFNGKQLDVSVSGYCSTYDVEDSVVTTLVVYGKKANKLCEYSVKVPVLSNRKTVVSGSMFGGTKSAVKVNNQWLDNYEVEL